jgi:hypothetical protein
MWEEAVAAYLRVQPGIFLMGLRRTTKYPRVAGVWAEI